MDQFLKKESKLKCPKMSTRGHVLFPIVTFNTFLYLYKIALSQLTASYSTMSVTLDYVTRMCQLCFCAEVKQCPLKCEHGKYQFFKVLD